MKFLFYHSRSFRFLYLILVVGGAVLTLESATAKEIEITYFPPKDVAQSTAKKIVERFEKYCEEDCVINLMGPDREVAVASLRLLGWPAAPVIIDAQEEFLHCYTVSTISGFGLLCLGSEMSSIDWTGGDAKKLRKRFETPPEFPSEAELEKIESPDKLRKLAMRAAGIATPDAQRVVMWYLSYVDQILDKDRVPDDDITGFMNCISSIGSFIGPLTQVPPQAVPILLKFALNPQRALKRRLPKVCEDELRYGAIMTLAQVYRRTLTGAINIAVIEDTGRLRFTAANYIAVATRTAAELDITLMEELLAVDSEAERDRIAEALGKSGNRAYRRLLWPLLEDSDKKVRYAAARGLAYLGDESGLELIKKQLDDDINESTRNTVIEALGRLGTEAACELLCKQLVTHVKDSNTVPVSIINAMYETGESFFVEQLFTVRTDGGQLHECVLDAIRVVADERSVPTLAKHLDDKDTKAAELAANLMIKLMKIKKEENEESVRAAKRWWSEQGTNPSNK